jgi:hypothetical protein
MLRFFTVPRLALNPDLIFETASRVNGLQGFPEYSCRWPANNKKATYFLGSGFFSEWRHVWLG